MTEETADKSIVVWYPSSYIPDIRELTSLYLYHDQTLLYRFKLLSMDYEKLKNSVSSTLLSTSGLQAAVAYDDMLKVLAKEKVIRLLRVGDFSKLYIPKNKAVRETIKSIFDRLQTPNGMLPTERTFGVLISYIVSKYFRCPLISDDTVLRSLDNQVKSPDVLSTLLVQSTICQLALPDVRAVHVDDLLKARAELQDELLEFRAGILKLTWLLHQQVQNKKDFEEIRQEANTLTNTVIKGSLLSLENRMRQHKNKRIRRMLFGTGKVLVEAVKLFLPGGTVEKMISGGKSLFQLATELDSAKPPEDQVATYLYRLRGKFRIKS